MDREPGDVRAVLAAERRRLLSQIDALAAVHVDIVEAAELVATDDEHDPEGATIGAARLTARPATRWCLDCAP